MNKAVPVLVNMGPKIIGQRLNKRGYEDKIAHWKCPGCPIFLVELHRRSDEALSILEKRADIHIKDCNVWMSFRNGAANRDVI